MEQSGGPHLGGAVVARLLIVGDICLYREGLAIALGRRDDFEQTVSTGDPCEALQLITAVPADVILVDLAMANALVTLRALAQAGTGAVLVALTVPDIEDDIIACAEAGASAYVTRDASIDQLVATVLAAKRGQLHCGAGVAGALFRRLNGVRSETPNGDGELSRREVQVLHLIEKGLSNKEISRSLGIQLATVKNHVHQILEKLKVSRRGEAAALFRRMP